MWFGMHHYSRGNLLATEQEISSGRSIDQALDCQFLFTHVPSILQVAVLDELVCAAGYGFGHVEDMDDRPSSLGSMATASMDEELPT